MALDSNGLPHILCYQPRATNTKLWYSHLVNNQWVTEEVVLAGFGINSGPGVCIDANDNIHVVYINRENRLAYAFFDGNSWATEQIDPARISSSWVEFVLDNDDNPHIAYTGQNQWCLKYATKEADEWVIEELSTTGGGSVTSLLIDSQNHPHILSWPSSAYRYWDGTEWQVESLTIPGTYSSLALDTQDRPQISYYYTHESEYSLWFMTKNSGEWEYVEVDPGIQQDKRGWDTHILCDSEDVLHIVYFCHNVGLIRHAWGGGIDWETETIDNVGIWYSSLDYQMVSDVHYISYYDDGEGFLRFATTQEYELESPSDLVAQVINVNDVLLSWNAPPPNPMNPATGYNIYMDDELVATTEGYIFEAVITGLGDGNYSFFVTGLSNETESDSSNQVEVEINLIPPHDFIAELRGNGVLCTWGRPLNTTNVTGFKIYRNGEEVGNTPSAAFIDTNVPEGIYSYWVTAIYNSIHESSASNTVEINTVSNSDLDLVPLSNELLGIYPNPFNPSTQISFSLAAKGSFELCIYNLKGEKIKTLANEIKKAGNYSVAWTGLDESGRKVPSGIYFARLKAQNQCSSRKLILLK
ncbi:MAG: T9SS type A sorting domain-containing protein [Candidatus Cloacimonadaceae bacterium]|jgi:hypothetical protein|nr:T9SS type A sorting domain-containing protein [Candidatus Cloacimonadota bacterium]MDY0128377.1 T9SS type A sorting domain-containing protein [Candidatus Cloacimonadaceae bacterium]MCB5254170.1 T9SS type A sorting domain-containing protein [Candidatus Cloacimonadota bacterium]MCK9178811.1 T9SS type A sorting domain-containing protein [Candidatus Cloacimonadota bacterium]MCK9242911.1 T9SS type A sorting domain-containing protein [Candidatus Cloacimonadota bacterium]